MEGYRFLRCFSLTSAYNAIGDRTRHIHGAFGKIDVTPLEGKQFTLAQSRRGCQENQGSLPILEIIQQQLDFGGGEYGGSRSPLGALPNEFDGVAIE